MTTAAAVHLGDALATVPRNALKGLRVLMVNMPLRESAPPNCAPLGPALLAARLEQYGASVVIADLNAERYHDAKAQRLGLAVAGRHPDTDEAASLLLGYAHGIEDQPDLVCLSGKITTLKWQQFVAKTVRRIWKDAYIVSGGGLATEFKEGLFQWVPQLDAIAHSEGDDVIIQIGLDALWRKGKGSYVVVNRQVYHGDRPRDLDALPAPAWHLLPRHVMDTYLQNEIWGLQANNSSATPFKMTRSINTVSSRGCPFACRFCFRGGQGERNYGVRSAESMAAEMDYLHKTYNIDFLSYLDDNFLVLPSRIAKLKDTVGKVCERTGIRWGTHGRLDEAADLRPGSDGLPWGEGRVERMAEAGCIYIGFGAESASPRVLDAMGKGGFITSNGTRHVNGYDLPVTMLEGYARTIKAGIHGNTTWITGYPSETLEDLKHSIAFILWQRTIVGNDAAVNKRFFTATAYPGTEMFANPAVRARLARGFGMSFDRYGQPICDKALEDYTLQLDDATKVLTDQNGEPVYYGAMPLPTFEKVRALLDEGDLEAVMRL